MADWNLHTLDALLFAESGAIQLSFNLVRQGPSDVPEVAADVTEESIHTQARAVCKRIIDNAADDLDRLATLKRIQDVLVTRRFATKTDAASAGANEATPAATPPSSEI